MLKKKKRQEILMPTDEKKNLLKLYDVIWSIMIYGSETWTIAK